MEDRFTYGAFVLAGGKSSRMGSDKGLIEFNGKKMVEHVLKSLGSHCIGIISNNDEYKQFGKPVWPDIYKNCGPLGGIHSALYNSDADWNLIVSCDIPFITSDFLFFLLKQIKTHKGKTRVPVHDNKAEPLCALYHRSCITEIENLLMKKELKMMDALEKLDTTYIEVPQEFDSSVLFRNINSPEDLHYQ
jgi:molybdopterin-guanine dinucleotide biosynthesis protein A